MKILSLLPAAAAAIMMLASCESTPVEDRFAVVDPNDFVPQRTVLIEEFTGQTCVNCPSAHELLNGLDAKFNTDNHVGFIVVGIHYSDFGLPAPRGFVVPECDEYAIGVPSAPSARINRRTEIIGTDLWTGSLLNEMIRKSSVKFTELTVSLKDSDSKISINGSVYASETYKNARLQLWLVEDDIKAPQMTKDGTIAQYNHHAVFRAALNGVKGQVIDLKEKTEVQIKPVEYPLPTYVNPKKIRVVAFVYTDTDGVLNAHQAKVN